MEPIWRATAQLKRRTSPLGGDVETKRWDASQSPASAQKYGRVLSHLLGFALFWLFILYRVGPQESPIPLTPLTSIPLRILGLLLIIDQRYRVRRAVVTGFDVASLLFIGYIGLGLAITTATMNRITIQSDYLGGFVFFFDLYLYFLVAREASTRAGFDVTIAYRWLLAGLSFSAVLGILQAVNFPGVRLFTKKVFPVSEYVVGMSLDSQARGVAHHANAFAQDTLTGLTLILGMAMRKRPNWIYIGVGILLVLALAVSQSRTSAATLFVMLIGISLYMLLNRRVGLGLAIIGGTAAFALVSLMAIYAFRVERFIAIIEPPRVEMRTAARDNMRDRIEVSLAAIDVGMQHPIFGVGIGPLYTSQPGYILRANYALRRLLLVQGPFFFFTYGIFGIAYVAFIIFYLLRYVRRTLSWKPQAPTLYLFGIFILINGMGENTMISHVPVAMLIVLGSSLVTDVPKRKVSRLPFGPRRSLLG